MKKTCFICRERAAAEGNPVCSDATCQAVWRACYTSVDDGKSSLEHVTDAAVLRAIREHELLERNRKSLLAAVDRRLRKVEGAASGGKAGGKAAAGKGFEMVGFEWLEATSLTPHPEALIPIDDEDKADIARSVKASGVWLPLTVEADPQADGKRRILDGCNRWRAVKDAAADGHGNSRLPCNLVRTDDPRAVIMGILGTGRKRTVGQRVMARLELCKAKALAAKDEGLAANFAKGRFPQVSNDTWTKFQGVTNLAKELNCSNKDVIAGLDLLWHIERKMRPVKDTKSMSEPLDLEVDVDVGYLKALTDKRLAVLSGAAPVRTWRRAVEGKVAVQRGKADTDYAKVCKRAMLSLRNCFENWMKISGKDRDGLAELWHDDLLVNAPPELQVVGKAVKR